MTAISIFDGLPNEAGTQWDFAPEFADVGEAEAYVRAHLTRSTVLTEYAGHAVVTILDEDGDATVVEVTAVDLTDHVLVETMPVALRASHEAAGGAGVWPHDGSERVLMHRDDAEVLVETDGGWSRIIRAARPEDDGEYDVILDASSFVP